MIPVHLKALEQQLKAKILKEGAILEKRALTDLTYKK